MNEFDKCIKIVQEMPIFCATDDKARDAFVIGFAEALKLAIIAELMKLQNNEDDR